jgi:hypothetical protein
MDHKDKNGSSVPASKMAGLSLDTRSGVPSGGNSSSPIRPEEFVNPQRPTSSSRSPVGSRTNVTSHSPGSASGNTTSQVGYTAPITSLSSEAPALQSFVPVQVDKTHRNRPSSGSIGAIPEMESGTVVKREEEDEVEGQEIIKTRESIERNKSESVALEDKKIIKRPVKRPTMKKGMAKKAGVVRKPKSAESAAKKLAARKQEYGDSDVMDEDGMDDFDDYEDGYGDDAEDDDGEDEVYCICRKPDDHKYMIGCDGGCSDWFHGTCVNISEDQGRLIDRFICVACNKRTDLFTTWRPLCRFPHCVQAARVEEDPKAPGVKVVRSFYCSDDHARRFWTELVREQGSGGWNRGLAGVGNSKRVFKRQDGSRTGQQKGIHRGGALSPQVLKALVAKISSASAFQSLGDELAFGTGLDKSYFDTDDLSALLNTPDLSPQDMSDLTDLHAHRADLLSRKHNASLRSKLLDRAITRRNAMISKLNVSKRAWCGYDADLILESDELIKRADELDGGKMQIDGEVKSEDDEAVPESVCQRKNCTVHAKWDSTEKQDVWSEIKLWEDKIEEVDRRMLEIGEAAGRRGMSGNGPATNGITA